MQDYQAAYDVLAEQLEGQGIDVVVVKELLKKSTYRNA